MKGKKAMDHVPRGDSPLLWAENNYVSGSVRVTMEGDVKVLRFVLDEVRLVEGDGRQLWDVVLELGAITLKLSNLAGAKGFFRLGGRVCRPSAKLVDLCRYLFQRSLGAANCQLRHESLGRSVRDKIHSLFGKAIGMIALGVVPVKMYVDYV
jgi:hypothetical protein